MYVCYVHDYTREVQMLMWKGGRRTSPQISVLNECEVQTMRLVEVGRTTNAAAANNSRIKGPASCTRARKKRKLRPLQDVSVAVAAACVSPISQRVCSLFTAILKISIQMVWRMVRSKLMTNIKLLTLINHQEFQMLHGYLEKCVLELILDCYKGGTPTKYLQNQLTLQRIAVCCWFHLVKSWMFIISFLCVLYDGVVGCD